MTRRGATLIESLVTLILLTLIGAGLIGAFSMGFHIHDDVNGLGNAYEDARKGVDLMADHLRNAQLNTNTGSGVLNSVIHSGAINDLTYYSDTTPTQIRYRLNGGRIERTDGGTTTAVNNVQSLTLTYYKMSSYNGSWTTTTNANVPTTAELPLIAGIEIRVVIAREGYTTEYTSMVRLRNSPKKNKLSGV